MPEHCVYMLSHIKPSSGPFQVYDLYIFTWSKAKYWKYPRVFQGLVFSKHICSCSSPRCRYVRPTYKPVLQLSLPQKPRFLPPFHHYLPSSPPLLTFVKHLQSFQHPLVTAMPAAAFCKMSGTNLSWLPADLPLPLTTISWFQYSPALLPFLLQLLSLLPYIDWVYTRDSRASKACLAYSSKTRWRFWSSLACMAINSTKKIKK